MASTTSFYVGSTDDSLGSFDSDARRHSTAVGDAAARGYRTEIARRRYPSFRTSDFLFARINGSRSYDLEHGENTKKKRQKYFTLGVCERVKGECFIVVEVSLCRLLATMPCVNIQIMPLFMITLANISSSSYLKNRDNKR